jgi:hypothetical protein
LQGNPLEVQEWCAGTVAARGATRHRPPGKQQAETGFFSSSLLQRRRRRDLQNNKETQQHRQLILVFISFVFQIFFGFFLF